MPDIEDARDLFEPLPDVDAGNASGEQASQAADESHDEVDELARKADPEGPGHGPDK